MIADTRGLVSGFRAVAIDQRAHGDSGTPDPPADWWDVGRDIVELIGDTTPVIGVGHSAGGAALILAELTRPGTFSALVLVEPIVSPPNTRYPDMAARALRRKPGFTSREAAYANFSSKVAFANWDDRAMRAYVSGGLREFGGRVTLKCVPESEAEFFRAATRHGAWDRLGEVNVPTLIVAGENSTTHQEPFLVELCSRLPHAEYEIVPATSHFVWMERPLAIARHVADRIRQCR